MDVKKEKKLKGKRYVKVFFTDKTSVAFSFEKQGGDDMSTLAANVKKAIDANKLAFEANGDLFILPIENIKYVQVSPAPEALPAGVIRDAVIVE
jgi:hypothetical protein